MCWSHMRSADIGALARRRSVLLFIAETWGLLVTCSVRDGETGVGWECSAVQWEWVSELASCVSVVKLSKLDMCLLLHAEIFDAVFAISSERGQRMLRSGSNLLVSQWCHAQPV